MSPDGKHVYVASNLSDAVAVFTRDSPSTPRRYPLTMICQVWRIPRAGVHAAARLRTTAGLATKRGPTPTIDDPTLLAVILDIGPRRRFTADSAWLRSQQSQGKLDSPVH